MKKFLAGLLIFALICVVACAEIDRIDEPVSVVEDIQFGWSPNEVRSRLCGYDSYDAETVGIGTKQSFDISSLALNEASINLPASYPFIIRLLEQNPISTEIGGYSMFVYDKSKEGEPLIAKGYAVFNGDSYLGIENLLSEQSGPAFSSVTDKEPVSNVLAALCESIEAEKVEKLSIRVEHFGERIVLVEHALLGGDGDFVIYTEVSANLDELERLRENLSNELGKLSVIIGEYKKEDAYIASDEALGTIKELFPDEALALIVRDRLAKFSIEQPVTQKELDQITQIAYFWSSEFGVVSSLDGIGYLRNLNRLAFYNSSAKNITELPTELFTLTHLNELDVSGSAISVLPESIGNLVNLSELAIRGTNVDRIPDTIGYLTKLETLDVSRTSISSLPDTVGSLVSLKSLDIGYTGITSLPEAVYSLNLTNLGMEGLPIK